MAANALAPGEIARACAETGAALVHLSTDYVFDGTKHAALIVENDPVNPLSVYGRSKEAGEAAIRAALDRHVILRTSWVFSAQGANFVKTMLRLAATRPELRIVADQHGAPTSARDIAHAIAAIAAANGPWGTFHFTSAEPTTWHGFAEAIVAGSRRPQTCRSMPSSLPNIPRPRAGPLTLFSIAPGSGKPMGLLNHPGAQLWCKCWPNCRTLAPQGNCWKTVASTAHLRALNRVCFRRLRHCLWLACCMLRLCVTATHAGISPKDTTKAGFGRSV